MADVNVGSLLRDLKAEFPGAGDIRLVENYTALEITLDRENSEDAERRVETVLARYGASIAPTPVNMRYAHVGKTKKISLTSAVCVILICIVVSVLTTFSLCKTLMPPPTADDNDKKPPSDTTADAGLPSHFQNLVKLDDVFNKFSFDGIDE